MNQLVFFFKNLFFLRHETISIFLFVSTFVLSPPYYKRGNTKDIQKHKGKQDSKTIDSPHGEKIGRVNPKRSRKHQKPAFIEQQENLCHSHFGRFCGYNRPHHYTQNNKNNYHNLIKKYNVSTFFLSDYKAHTVNNAKSKTHTINNHQKASLSRATFKKQSATPSPITDTHHPQTLHFTNSPPRAILLSSYGTPSPQHPIPHHHRTPRQPTVRIRDGNHARAAFHPTRREHTATPTRTNTRPRSRTDAPRRNVTNSLRLPITTRRLLLRSTRQRPINGSHWKTRPQQIQNRST